MAKFGDKIMFHRVFFSKIKTYSFHSREIMQYFWLVTGKSFFLQGTHNKTNNFIIKTFV